MKSEVLSTYYRLHQLYSPFDSNRLITSAGLFEVRKCAESGNIDSIYGNPTHACYNAYNIDYGA